MGVNRYNIDKQRLKKLTSLNRNAVNLITPKQRRELDMLRSQYAIATLEMTKESMQKVITYLEEMVRLDSATSSDQARLVILKDRLENE